MTTVSLEDFDGGDVDVKAKVYLLRGRHVHLSVVRNGLNLEVTVPKVGLEMR